MKITFFIAGLLLSISSFAKIRLPNILASNMVLQQQSRVALWGWAAAGERIVVGTSWNNHTDTIQADGDAKWKTYVQTPVAGGPYTITFKGHNTVTLENIMIGEVWVCSGQSNMEWSSDQNLKQIIDEMPNSANTNIRLFGIPKTTATTLQDDIPGTWNVCGPESLKGFSAVAYFFGKKLQEALGVPVGLVNASWGGTPAEVWTPAEVTDSDDVLKKAAAQLQPAPWWPIQPARAYNAMIYPITNLNISGAIWYQGESNTLTSATYSRLFTSMIGAWRKAWQKDIPFYYVQIAPFAYANKNVGALLREQQVKSLAYPHTGMAVITDLVDDVNNIHPQNKRDVGTRLANLALAGTYKKGGIAAVTSPLFKKMEIKGDKAILFFDNAPNGFITKDNNAPNEFYIAGADKNFIPAAVKIEKNRIIVSNKQLKAPVAVRFAFSNTALPNLFSKDGLPVSPFRTDNWEMDTSPEKK